MSMFMHRGGVVIVMGVMIVTTLFAYPIQVFAQTDPALMDSSMREFMLQESRDGKSMVDLLYIKQESTALRRNIILHFCDTFLQTRDDENMEQFAWDTRGYRYDPRQSLFMFGMCVLVDEVSNGREIVKEQYRYRNYKEVFEQVKYTNWPQQDINEYWKTEKPLPDLLADLRWIPIQPLLDGQTAYTPCNPATSMQNCRFSRFAPTIFSNIMNEYSNIKLATIYGFRYPLIEWEDALTLAIDDFNASYFGDLLDPQTPCNEQWVGYISEWPLVGDRAHCLHPMTYKELEETIKSAASIMEKLKFLDAEVLFSVEDNAACDYENPKASLLRCSAGNRWDISVDSDRQSFYNLYLNEIMWYNLFLDYYMNLIQENNAYSPLTFGALSYTYQQNEKEVKTIAYEKSLSQQAAFQTMRMLSNLYTTYPVYIALRAYREDLLQYRKNIAKVFTPMDQLYFKLRNVQEAWEEGS